MSLTIYGQSAASVSDNFSIDYDLSVISFFPNPVKEKLNILFTNKEIKTVVLTDPMGVELFRKRYEDTSFTQIDVNDLPQNRMYILYIRDEEGATEVYKINKDI